MRTFILLLSTGVALPALAQTTWTYRATANSPRAAAGKPGLYLIPTSDTSGTLQRYLKSTDGINWGTNVLLPPTAPSNFSPGLVCFNGRFVGFGSSNSIWYADTGLTQTTVAPPSGTSYSCLDMAFGNSVWIGTQVDGRVIRSTTNASSWSFVTTPADFLRAITFGNGIFLAEAPLAGASLTSPNGLAWNIGPEIPGGELCFESGRFQTDSHTSVDGITWEVRTGAFDLPPECYYLRAGGGAVVTWNYDGQPAFFTHTGSAWSSPHPSGVLSSIRDVSFCGDLWIATTDNGKILTSPIPTLPAPVAPVLNVAPALRLSWQSQTGRSYLIQRSVNNTAWTDHTGTMLGTGAVMEWLAPAATSKEFFRVQVR